MLNVSVRPQPAAVAAVSALAATAGKTSSDEILVEQIAAGSKPAMQALFVRHRTYVYRWLLRLVSNETLAEDLLSEVFLDVWRQAGRFQYRSSVSTWFMSIAHHKALSACRRRTEGADLDEKIEATVADPANDPEVALQEKDRGELVRRALMRLSPEHREIIDLVYYHEKSVDEVAQILDVPSSAVKTRMFYARKKLAELVKGAEALTRQSNLRNRTMHLTRALHLCALPMALALFLGPARAQAPGHSTDEAPLELPAAAPLDLSTPEPDSGKLKGMTPFADRASALDWNGKAGIDYSKPSILQPDQLLAGAVPDQSSGVAWATITAPGFEAPLGWDKTSIETRVDPSQEQGKLGTTLSRSVPVGDDISLTLQNGVSLTRTLPNATGQVHNWAISQALRFNILPTDTSVSVGADISSTDDKWLRTLSAEQKLFGGPFSVTGSVSETPTGDLSKSLKAGFKQNW